MRWQWFLVAVSVAGFVLDLVEHRMLSDASTDPGSVDTVDRWRALVAVGELIVYVIGIVIFLFWFHRAYRNVLALWPGDLRFGTGWAVGAWFVPILNLARPKQMTNDIWRSGDPLAGEADDLQARPVSPLLHRWWAAWLVAGFLDNAAFRGFDDSTIAALRSSLTTDAVSEVATVVASVLVILVISRATRRQERRAELLRADAGTDPAPDVAPASAA